MLADYPAPFEDLDISTRSETWHRGETVAKAETIYHGGLLQVRLRYYDAAETRPGLPADVAARVSQVTATTTTVELVNTSPLHARLVILQAGAFGEHRFTRAVVELAEVDVDGPHLTLLLPPGALGASGPRHKALLLPPQLFAGRVRVTCSRVSTSC